jgi:hypothetical protein
LARAVRWPLGGISGAVGAVLLSSPPRGFSLSLDFLLTAHCPLLTAHCTLCPAGATLPAESSHPNCRPRHPTSIVWIGNCIDRNRIARFSMNAFSACTTSR